MTSEPTSQEVRVSTLHGDRPCIRCGFNLQGQPVVREPVYGMIMVRCPECSTVASLQEYPLLGRWANRFAAVLAAAWLLLLLGGVLASGGITFGTTEAAIQSSSERLSLTISRKYVEWYNAADEKTKANVTKWGGQAPQIGSYTTIDATWWNAQDPSIFLAELGGVRLAMNRGVADPLIWSVISGAMLGAVWSILLLALRRPRLLLMGLLIIGVAFTYEFLWGSLSRTWSMSRYMAGAIWVQEAASHILAPWVTGFALGLSLLGLCLGLWFGRPLTRWLVRLLLPPRLWAPLSFLWIAEKLPPPKPRTG